MTDLIITWIIPLCASVIRIMFTGHSETHTILICVLLGALYDFSPGSFYLFLLDGGEEEGRIIANSSFVFSLRQKAILRIDFETTLSLSPEIDSSRHHHHIDSCYNTSTRLVVFVLF